MDKDEAEAVGYFSLLGILVVAAAAGLVWLLQQWH